MKVSSQEPPQTVRPFTGTSHQATAGGLPPCARAGDRSQISQTAHHAPRWVERSQRLEERYRQLAHYHLRRMTRADLALLSPDYQQEITLAMHAALRGWARKRASDMQFSSYLWWHLSKRLTRYGTGSLATDGNQREPDTTPQG